MTKWGYVQADKKIRLPRIERDDVITVHEDENSHLWAVSYADFLMALMSFFILFYSADPQTKNSIIMNLAQEFSNSGKTDLASGAGGLNGGGGNFEKSRLPSNFAESFSQLNVTMEKDEASLVINFQDNMYPPGKHDFSYDQKLSVQEVLKKIKPFSENVNLYFEGHADNRPVQKTKTDIVVDNFVLSSLRASSALILAKSLGFSEKKLFIQAASSNIRNSRSLSIRIEPRAEPAPASDPVKDPVNKETL